MRVAIVDYGMGNVGSLSNMLRRLGHTPIVTGRDDHILAADRLILPGVGAFDRGMSSLAERGLIDALSRAVFERGTPILGICLGMQLLTNHSEEGSLAGLGWLRASTVRFAFPADRPMPRLPHMGWNEVTVRNAGCLTTWVEPESRLYFAHSYHLKTDDESMIIAETEYGYRFPAIVGRGNIYGVQAHPEKSHRFGLAFLRSFVAP